MKKPTLALALTALGAWAQPAGAETGRSIALILDAETGEKRAYAHSRSTRLALIPSTYSITFGKAEWRDIEIKPGRTTVLKPGKLILKEPGGQKYRAIYSQAGEKLGSVNGHNNERLLPPPGRYSLDVGDGQRAEFEIKEGADMEIEIQ